MANLQRTIPGVLRDAVEKWPQKIAIQDDGVELSFEQLESQAKACAKAMIASDFQVGDRFAIWAPNIHEWVWTAIGGMLAGGILVPLNTRYRGLEAADILARSEANILFTTNGFLNTDYPAMLAKQDLPKLDKIILLRSEQVGDTEHQPIDDFLKLSQDQTEQELVQRAEQLNGNSISDIMYTSGTTGAPKGVVSTHGQTVAIFETWSNTVGLNATDRYLIVNPFFHSFGYKAGWLSCLIQGATALPMAVFNPAQTLQIIEQERISILPGAPTIFQTLLAEPVLTTTNISSLRCAVTGAASVPEQLVRDMHHVLGFDKVFTAYGLTECPVVSITRPGDELGLVANTAGKAIDGTDIQILDAQGERCPPGEVGRIMVKGYNVMQAYFQDAVATKDTINSQGWLDTGDLGWKDQNGYVKVTDRIKDMYIAGGFNCYPAEIENLLLLHPDINDVAVVGVTEERLGEVGHAYIVNADQNLTHADLTQWAREHMANFKVPRHFTLVGELPRNASGKVQKFKLLELTNQHKLN